MQRNVTRPRAEGSLMAVPAAFFMCHKYVKYETITIVLTMLSSIIIPDQISSFVLLFIFLLAHTAGPVGQLMIK